MSQRQCVLQIMSRRLSNSNARDETSAEYSRARFGSAISPTRPQKPPKNFLEINWKQQFKTPPIRAIISFQSGATPYEKRRFITLSSPLHHHFCDAPSAAKPAFSLWFPWAFARPVCATRPRHRLTIRRTTHRPLATRSNFFFES